MPEKDRTVYFIGSVHEFMTVQGTSGYRRVDPPVCAEVTTTTGVATDRPWHIAFATLPGSNSASVASLDVHRVG